MWVFGERPLARPCSLGRGLPSRGARPFPELAPASPQRRAPRDRQTPPGPRSSPTATRSEAPKETPEPAQTLATTLAPPAVAGVSWNPVGTEVGGHPAAYLSEDEDGQVALMWMDPQLLSFRYIPGYEVPGSGPRTAADEDPSSWVPNLVAAFNGGFQLSDGAGGYFYLGETVKDLEDGLGSWS